MCDLNNPILSDQIITYLGNKRRLIKFIDKTVDKLIKDDDELKNKALSDISFFDIFSGSGVVSRYGKLKGLEVHSNDLEIYSKIIQEAIIGINKSEVQGIFKVVFDNYTKSGTVIELIDDDYYQAILNYLNSLSNVQDQKNTYWSIHYAPKDTSNPDFHNERLFYTQENARKIDAVQEQIQVEAIFGEKSKNIIMASLMYNMTWHINTSGTMKGFHNGWGGKGKNALNRILSDIVLEKLPFVGGVKGTVYNDYAEKVFSNNNLKKMDIIYADPPYNQHQYSANYNHLTTLALNDRYEPGKVVQGSRAGIRKTHTRSDFCYSSKSKNDKSLMLAEKAFIEFIDGVKAKYIVMSYNNEGVVSIDRLMDLMSEGLKNAISIEYQVHDKFKGGKGTQTSNKVMEYLIIIEQGKAQSKADFEKIKEDLLHNTEKHLFLDKFINYEGVCRAGFIKECDSILVNDTFEILKDKNMFLKCDAKTFKVIDEHISLLSKEEIEALKLHEMTSLDLMNAYIEEGDIELAEGLLNVFKIKKYENELKDFEKRISAIKELTELTDWALIDGKLHRVFVLDDFIQAIGFMMQVAIAAEKMDHHPDWSNVYKTVTVDLTTHSKGCVTQQDSELAKKMDDIFNSFK